MGAAQVPCFTKRPHRDSKNCKYLHCYNTDKTKQNQSTKQKIKWVWLKFLVLPNVPTGIVKTVNTYIVTILTKQNKIKAQSKK